MSNPRKSFFSTIGTVIEVFGSATAVSRAIEIGRAPEARHLKALGIDPDTYRSIGQ